MKSSIVSLAEELHDAAVQMDRTISELMSTLKEYKQFCDTQIKEVKKI